MQHLILMHLDTIQFWKKVSTNLLFSGEVNKACHEFIDSQSKLAKAFIGEIL